ncbi:MAG: hypothetical protein JW751_20990 [Polyangiaceae bacterium]|nr:hypothetical protein [Polyangiaceae bacterium]
MDTEQWAVFVVVNHTRREILTGAGAVRFERPIPLSELVERPYPGGGASLTGRLLAGHWSFNEDRVVAVARIPTSDSNEASALASDLRRDVQALGSLSPYAWQLLADGYRVLGGEFRPGTPPSC